MVPNNIMKPLAKGFLLMTNILNTLRIEKLSVPELVASDSTASLECSYAAAGDDVTVRWLLNGSQVYEWSRGAEPVASGALEDKIEKNRGAVVEGMKHSLRIAELSPELSGEYTCIVQSRGQEARLNKTMIIFSPEHGFELTLTRTHGALHASCVASQVYPQPDLTIEYNKAPVPQQQRIWRVGAYYAAECGALVRHADTRGEVACRLRIPQVDYTVITKKYVEHENLHNGGFISKINAILTTVVFLIINAVNVSN